MRRRSYTPEIAKAFDFKEGRPPVVGTNSNIAFRDDEGRTFLIWVRPLQPIWFRRSVREHRVRAQCVACKKQLSAGRIHQHVCKKGGKNNAQ